MPQPTDPMPLTSSTDPRRVAVLDDLAAEQSEVDDLVAMLDEPEWSTPTPSEGWDIRDQIGHLAYFDGRARLAASDPERFVAERDAAFATGDMAGFMESSLHRARASSGAERRRWWAGEPGGMVTRGNGAAGASGAASRTAWPCRVAVITGSRVIAR